MTWTAPEHWLRIETIDAHTEGEPLRVIVAGFPELEGDTVLARRRVARAEHDELRRALMWEPRGHADMYGCLVMPPVRPGSDFSVLFMHNEGYSTMCGHGIIGVAKIAVEAGWIDGSGRERPVAIDTPAGLVRATAILDGERVREVRFVNVPSFAPALGRAVEVEGLGSVSYDLAFGGAFYAYVDADALGLSLTPGAAADLIDAGRRITRAVSSSAGGDIAHPDDPDLGFLYGTVFTSAAADAAHHSRHVCIFADGELDRSPTGTAVSGRLAILHARGAYSGDAEIIVESIIGGRFSGRVVDTTSVGGHAAVVPEVGGRAWVTGRHEFLIDPEDPWRDGFLVR
ncbi:MAG: proline racemase family protein [Gemmatimonadota bacterium]|uniref:proline racemase family protein n=1 Tax=Candidatus Palauibacter scopulicola TaxID=3056741 RepID=UPI0023A15171|nr:proline racemase family protein [Candidatus Palauibacter scopulicola]MDE2663857.1 proline racemase family protein [Candidatus Palauibacter scopulicola]